MKKILKVGIAVLLCTQLIVLTSVGTQEKYEKIEIDKNPLGRQIEWTKYPGNPVLPEPPETAWDHFTGDVHVIKDGDLYKMWYGANRDGKRTQIGYATSPDGINWTRHPEPVLVLGEPGSWDAEGVETPTVLKINDIYHMWYSGLSGPGDEGYYQIGYATSRDGINWVKYPGNPVLKLGENGSWDELMVADQSVIFDGNTFKMWYGGFGETVHVCIGYATSSDGVNWTKYSGNPVLEPDSEIWYDMIIEPFVLYNGRNYEMWYIKNDNPDFVYSKIEYATSPDGVTWTKYIGNPVLEGGPEKWDYYGVWAPTVLLEETLYKMWYTGWELDTVRWVWHLATGLATAPVKKPQEVNDVYRNLADFGSIAYLKEGRCKQFSSYDRSGGNDDYYNFLRVEPDGACVLAEMQGPGCITAVWMTGIDLQNGTIQIYFDGETVPTVECKLSEFFGFGDYDPFFHPLTGFSSGGYYCYIPMPYVESCVVKVKDGGFPFYYHVTYQEFDSSEGVRTFTVPLKEPDKTYLAKIVDMWNNCGKDPKRYDTKLVRLDGNITIAPRSTSRIVDIDGKGIIWRFFTKTHPDLWLKMYWDNEPLPSVYSPFDAFFGVFDGNFYKSLPIGITKDGSYCYFPMPFKDSALIEVENRGDEPVSIPYIVEYERKSVLPSDIGRFHAKYEKQHPTVKGKNYVILETTGKGHFVGCQLYMDWTRALWYLEGDEMIYVDGEDFPSIYGTGTEDYFHAGWYFNTGTFDLPWHGCTILDAERFRTAAYRFHISDYIPFTSSLNFTIEHGHGNLINADYSSIAYWYAAYEEIDDEEPPNVKITRPEKGRLYIRDRDVTSFPFGIPIVFGGITLKCEAYDDIGIDGVGFFVDNNLRYIDYKPPFEWVWDEKAFGKHEIKAIAYDKDGNTAEDEIDVMIFNFGV